MSVTIHPTAVIGQGARIGEGTTIGPFAVVEPGAVIGRDNALGAGCYIFAAVRMGNRNRLMRGASLGGEPQHVQYKGEPTRLVIGDGNFFGENITVHRGTMETGETRVGNDNFLMSNVHVGHDCRLGNGIIMASGAILGGHVAVHDRANFGGNAGVHHFCRIGTLAMVGGLARVRQDVLPFTIASESNRLFGLNWIGLRRGGLPLANRSLLKEAYRRFCVRCEPIAGLLAWLRAQPEDPLLDAWREFLSAKSKRGYARGGGEDEGEP
jgi:UDP-N-acetylglucosamine acyltransferase